MSKLSSKKRGERNSKEVSFEEIVNKEPYQKLITAKKRFLVPSIILFFGLYLLFPVLISYSNVLDTTAIGDISWAWIYALLLFVMTWTFATVYMKKAATFDHMAESIWKEDDLERRKA